VESLLVFINDYLITTDLSAFCITTIMFDYGERPYNHPCLPSLGSSP
jgi:hypothetical protein